MGHGVSALGTVAAVSSVAGEHGVGLHLPGWRRIADSWIYAALAPRSRQNRLEQKNHVPSNVGNVVFLVCHDGAGCMVQFKLPQAVHLLAVLTDQREG